MEEVVGQNGSNQELFLVKVKHAVQHNWTWRAQRIVWKRRREHCGGVCWHYHECVAEVRYTWSLLQDCSGASAQCHEEIGMFSGIWACLGAWRQCTPSHDLPPCDDLFQWTAFQRIPLSWCWSRLQFTPGLSCLDQCGWAWHKTVSWMSHTPERSVHNMVFPWPLCTHIQLDVMNWGTVSCFRASVGSPMVIMLSSLVCKRCVASLTRVSMSTTSSSLLLASVSSQLAVTSTPPGSPTSSAQCAEVWLLILPLSL